MNSNLEYIQLAPGLTISRVLTGLWQIADLERDGNTLDPNETAKTMKPYADTGFTTFDMADHYGSAEVIAGVFQKNHTAKQPVQLLTKWVPQPGAITKEMVRDAVQRSMDRLQVSSVDLMQFHAWSYGDPRWLDGLFFLAELKAEGLIKHIGLTNFDTAHLRVAVKSGIPIVSNQVCYSLLDQRAAGAMTAFCVTNNIKLLAFGTIAGGFLTNRWIDQPEPIISEQLTWSQMKYKRFIDAAGGWNTFQQLLHVVKKIADQHQTSISTVASRYMLEQPAVGGVIIGARLGKSEHIQENQNLFSFTLTEANKKEIKEALQLLNTIPGDCGDEYRKPPFLTASGDLSHHVKSFPSPYPVKQGANGRSKALSGTVWEDLAGFSRAVKKGNRILISGTTATHGSKAIGGNDPAAQAHFAIDKIEGALQSLGSKLEEVVRTRIFIRNISDWEAIARVHGERFKDIQPANTMVKAELIGDEYLVEIEAEAIVNE
jgi:aryl-alcohol dehydrogenase-like predicted oxidoreductase/enamine deaminase RidA (YjgF/YER057c/UK114 family)